MAKSLPQTCRDVEADIMRLTVLMVAYGNDATVMYSFSVTGQGASYTVSVAHRGVVFTETHAELLEAFLAAQARLAGTDTPPPF